MQVYPRNTPETNLLSDEDRHTLEVGSKIARDFIERRGVYTVTRPRDLPKGFSGRQRQRGPGILSKIYRPNGKTSWSFRPRNPDPDKPGRKYEQPCKYYGGPGNVLDVLPDEHVLINDVSIPVYFVEGIKKADSLRTALRAAGIQAVVIAISGVWNWMSDGKPIPDMYDIPVEGRAVTITFDSDMLSNPKVQDAAGGLAEHLTGRGAEVWITYFEDALDGSKVGADDFFVADGTVSEYKLLNRRYDPADFARVRMSRSEKLRDSYKSLLAEWFSYDWQHFVGKPKVNRETGEITDNPNWQRGYGAREAMLALITLVPERGKIKDAEIEVQAGVRTITDRSPLSRDSTSKALLNLQADGFITIIEPDSKEKARTYRLKLPARRSDTMESKAKETEREEEFHRVSEVRAPSVPRLRWSTPAGRYKREFETVKGRGVVRATGAKPKDAQDPPRAIKRLGPHRGAVVDALEDNSRELHIENLMEVLHYTGRKRDFRSRRLKDLIESGVIELEDDVTRLSAAWRENLDARRERDGEVQQARNQADKHRQEQEKYRVWREREKKGTPQASLDAARCTKEKREQRLQEIEKEKRRDQDPTPPEVERFVRRILGNHKRMRLGLLCEVAREQGLRWRDIPPAVERMGYRVEKLPEYQNAAFIFTDRGVA